MTISKSKHAALLMGLDVPNNRCITEHVLHFARLRVLDLLIFPQAEIQGKDIDSQEMKDAARVVMDMLGIGDPPVFHILPE